MDVKTGVEVVPKVVQEGMVQSSVTAGKNLTPFHISLSFGFYSKLHWFFKYLSKELRKTHPVSLL